MHMTRTVFATGDQEQWLADGVTEIDDRLWNPDGSCLSSEPVDASGLDKFMKSACNSRQSGGRSVEPKLGYTRIRRARYQRVNILTQ